MIGAGGLVYPSSRGVEEEGRSSGVGMIWMGQEVGAGEEGQGSQGKREHHKEGTVGYRDIPRGWRWCRWATGSSAVAASRAIKDDF